MAESPVLRTVTGMNHSWVIHGLRTTVGLVVTVVVAMTSVPTSAGTTRQHRPSWSGDPGHAATGAALENLVAQGTPGVIARADLGRRSWQGSAGVAELDRNRPRVPAEHFRIGSVTKTFTAVTVLKLEAEGRLSLQDSVEAWLPGTLDDTGYDARRISIRQLLNHTSGVFDILQDRGFVDRYRGPAFLEHRYDSWTPESLVGIATAHPPLFAPGAGWSYSSTNYLLAGMIIEAATGESYADAVRTRVLRPLRLHGTVVPGFSPTLPKPHALAYSRLFVDAPDADIYDATEFNPSLAGAAGEIISTTRDLNRFFRALFAGRILPVPQQRELLTGVDTGRGYHYGLGVRTYRLPCGTRWGHDGDILGSVTRTVSTADGRHVLSVNTNDNWHDDDLMTEVFTAEFCR